MANVLICPSERPQVAFLAQTAPLVAVPILGEALVNHWIEFLANAGAKEVLVLATDRPDMVRSVVDNGSRWGVRVQVQAELKEPTVEEAAARLPPQNADPGEPKVVVMDHLPGIEELSLFRSYRDWFAGVLASMARVAAPDRIGLRELQPQVWCGRRGHISPRAKLYGPCWVGDHVRIAAEAVVGPNAVLENGVVVDSASEIRTSVIGPDTFVGALTRVEDSIACGSTLINWRTGSCTQVPDPFLLCALGQRYQPGQGRSALSWLRRNLGQILLRPWSFMMGFPARWRRL